MNYKFRCCALEVRRKTECFQYCVLIGRKIKDFVFKDYLTIKLI